MVIMFRLKTFIHAATAAFVAIAAIAAASPSQAQGRGSTGNIRVELVKAGFIIGVQGGNGTLTFKGHQYPLNIGGVGLGATVGASRAVLVGTASNLHTAADIVGTYGQAEAGLAVVTGRKGARLRNEKGVVLNLRGWQTGLEFSLDLSGMVISIR
jgi:hypothetical protein